MASEHTKGIVVINGRKFSASTGHPIDGVSKAHHQTHTASKSEHARARKVTQSVDGVSRSHTDSHERHARKMHRGVQPTARTIKIHPKGPAAPTITPISDAKKATHHLRQSARLTAEREKRASSIERSTKISKFSSGSSRGATREARTPSLAVAPPPVAEAAVPSPASSSLVALTLQDAAEEARARALTKHHRLRLKPRAISMLAAAFSVLVISGYVLYLNVPNLTLRVAAARSGIDAQVPGYTPEGFRFSGPVSYSPGFVAISFRSTGDDGREYRIAERKSEWDSSSLLENYVRHQDGQYHTLRNRGLTIYVYGEAEAAWVNGGILYTLEGNATLNHDQLLRIAASI